RKIKYEAQLTSEVLRYKGLGRLPMDRNPLAWWDSHQQSLPLLREIAMRVLCVPASSAASERLFSKAGLTETKLRNRLRGPKVAQLVTL
ncbi:unnamed protein product, partial [Hapterophycus canaliculatus]